MGENISDRLITDWIVGRPGTSRADLPPVETLNDDACGICKDNDEKDDDNMLLCEGCDYACHTFCCDPPLDAIPKGDWWSGVQREAEGGEKNGKKSSQVT